MVVSLRLKSEDKIIKKTRNRRVNKLHVLYDYILVIFTENKININEILY